MSAGKRIGSPRIKKPQPLFPDPQRGLRPLVIIDAGRKQCSRDVTHCTTTGQEVLKSPRGECREDDNGRLTVSRCSTKKSAKGDARASRHPELSSGEETSGERENSRRAWDVPSSISHETRGEPAGAGGDGFTELLVVEQSVPNVWLAMPWEETHRKTDIEI